MQHKKRIIPTTMATQHPDNACAPYWEQDGDGFVSVYEELPECVSCFSDLDVCEFMWDWEGKYTEEGVIDKMFTQYHDYFFKHQLGKEKFLTFRLPNVWQEKGYSLLRALMVILTSEDFARDLKFHTPPLFEVILPMTEHARQLLYIQKAFRELACFKAQMFDHIPHRNSDYLEMIPLVEGVGNQIAVRDLLEEYTRLHQRYFKQKPAYIRPFLARSDPAMVSGLLATVLANKIALSDIRDFSREHKIPTYPIIGVGSLVFRGGLTPDTVAEFVREYKGVRTVTIQSAFRYDFNFAKVKRAIAYLNTHLHADAAHIPASERPLLECVINNSERVYQKTLRHILPEVQPLFDAVPRRRERRLHVGLLAYQRRMGATKLPRAISFTAGFYSLGIPPELIGLGRSLAQLNVEELCIVRKHYVNLKQNIVRAGRYVNKKNVAQLARINPAWRDIQNDIALVEQVFNIQLGPRQKNDFQHEQITTKVFQARTNMKRLSALISESGKIRKSLG